MKTQVSLVFKIEIQTDLYGLKQENKNNIPKRDS